ncbi:multisubunit sodium/proton antiporter, MrpG subunit [Lentibacillus persicus]|uniref:Multisubunit sodium/proton antiporter, MrpG subunit n=1 Tax=Lentibacillus persicus TaxID=640948 RepID=A0A1I1TH27_9BACI|nr:monovalent cation/H(+) antiporter subunit G [Lentibacillus persicus]SFD56458.1 multisubunit sodium/proton antiporter, MrpG subunit [Lentibacillus persicus]
MIETWIDIIFNIIIAIFLLSGTFFLISSSIGLIRFPDVYTRLHATTKASTLGIAGLLIGAFLFLFVEHGIISGKLLLAIVFTLLTAPLGAHMISRAAHRVGIKPVTKQRSDEYEKAIQKEKQQQK